MKKKCSRCKKYLKTSHFGYCKHSKDNLRWQCKSCRKIEAQKRKENLGTEAYRIKAREYYHKYKHTKHYKLYKASNRWKQINRIADINRNLRQPEKRKARYAVANAIKAKKLLPIKEQTCVYCNTMAQHYHHYLGYSKKHWLDVEPICISCHCKIENKIRLHKNSITYPCLNGVTGTTLVCQNPMLG